MTNPMTFSPAQIATALRTAANHLEGAGGRVEDHLRSATWNSPKFYTLAHSAFINAGDGLTPGAYQDMHDAALTAWALRRAADQLDEIPTGPEGKRGNR